jgi:dolichol-phosphate mannosyltransferase
MMVSIILPTYNEAENIKIIVPRLFEVLNKENMEGEIIIIDDNSPDGTAVVARSMANEYPIGVYVRKNERGLATAVMKGFEVAKGNICIVMDADLSHPVEKIPEMLKPILESDFDATVGTRYIEGGSCNNWPLIRKIVSKGAALLAWKLTTLSDPTSGFMAIKKGVLEGVKLDPIGWKIVLEIIVRTNCRFLEIPISFSDRIEGKSKLNFKVQLDYVAHLMKLYSYKYSNVFQFIKFCIVGFTGLFIDTAVLVSIVEIFLLDPRVAAIFAFLTAVSWNYILNRFWTFDLGKQTKISYSYIFFVLICVVGLGIRLGIMHLLIEYAGMDRKPWYILASILGIFGGTIFNYLGSRYLAFSKSLVYNKLNKA